MGAWACTRCGGCCKRLLFTSPEGRTIGLWLMPSETGLFPPEAVFPLAGHGSPVEVTAYQLGVDRCPHYRESPSGFGECGIHDRRPTACRAFPVLSRYRVSTACLAVSRIHDGVEPGSLAAEMEAHGREVAHDLSHPPPDCVWPLDERRWVPLDGRHPRPAMEGRP